jgi:hypothetical protein
VAKDPDYPRRQDDEPCYYAQYRYFIPVHEQSLKDLQDWSRDGGSVDLVDADWQSTIERWLDEDFSEEDGELS